MSEITNKKLDVAADWLKKHFDAEGVLFVVVTKSQSGSGGGFETGHQRNMIKHIEKTLDDMKKKLAATDSLNFLAETIVRNMPNDLKKQFEEFMIHKNPETKKTVEDIIKRAQKNKSE